MQFSHISQFYCVTQKVLDILLHTCEAISPKPFGSHGIYVHKMKLEGCRKLNILSFFQVCLARVYKFSMYSKVFFNNDAPTVLEFPIFCCFWCNSRVNGPFILNPNLEKKSLFGMKSSEMKLNPSSFFLSLFAFPSSHGNRGSKKDIFISYALVSLFLSRHPLLESRFIATKSCKQIDCGTLKTDWIPYFNDILLQFMSDEVSILGIFFELCVAFSLISVHYVLNTREEAKVKYQLLAVNLYVKQSLKHPVVNIKFNSKN